MNNLHQDYSLFFEFIEVYEPAGFSGIDRQDPLILDLEEMTIANNQYFFVSDLLQGKVIYTSNRSFNMLGIKPEELNPYHNVEAIHPDELYRNTSGWAKLLKIASDLHSAKKGFSILSVNMKMKNPQGIYSDVLFQCYSFFSRYPHDTVYVLIAITNINSFKMKKQGYHYYIGNDISYFRYPDKKLLKIGNLLTKREFEIVKLIAAGHSSEQIAKELFLSLYTVNTHRGNILKKTKKAHISDVIHDLQERGLL